MMFESCIFMVNVCYMKVVVDGNLLMYVGIEGGWVVQGQVYIVIVYCDQVVIYCSELGGR